MDKLNFDCGWEFTEATDIYTMAQARWEPVNLPHDLAITKPRNAHHPTGKDGGYAWSGAVTYRKKFTVPAEWRGKSIQLEFEGVYMNAEVSINRQLVALHPYGYTSFVVDLTPPIKYGAENTLTVVVNNSAQPNSRWYSGMGIYRHVWLRTGGALRIQPWGVFVTTPVVDQTASVVSITTELDGAASGALLRSTICDASGTVVATTSSPVEEMNLRQTLTVENARLWSVDEPYLYTLTSEVLVNNQVLDTETTTFGIRSIAFDVNYGFSLNGIPLKLRGGCVHHDHGLLGAASYDRAEERKIEILKGASFNAIRCAHNPPAPALLDACDRLGILVIDESFDCWRTGKKINDYHLYFEDWWQRDTESMVKRDRNHPSIILWSIGNEVPERTGVSDGHAWTRRQAEFVRSLDPTRGVTSAMHFLYEDLMAEPELMANFASVTSAQDFFALKNQVPDSPEKDVVGNRTREFCEALDVVGYNYLYRRYEWDHQRFPERIIVGSETYPLQAYDFWHETRRLPFVIGDFVWTAFDYLGESGLGKVSVDAPTLWYGTAVYPYHLAHCGDFDICGFKRPQSVYRDLLWGVREEPFIGVLDPQLHGKTLNLSQWSWDPVIDSWSFPGQAGKPTRVDVYSVDDEVELFVNGISIGRQPAGELPKNKTTFEVVYQPGRIEAVGYRGGQEVSRTHLDTCGAPTALRLSADRAEIRSPHGDLAYVTVEVIDEKGHAVKYAEPQVSFEISGVGILAAVGTANPVSEELYVGTTRKAWQGRLMAVVCSTGQVGEIVLEAMAEGLAPAKITLQAR